MSDRPADTHAAAEGRDSPLGSLIGIVDEFGTIWAGEAGDPAAEVIGDLVRETDETWALYVDLSKAREI